MSDQTTIQVNFARPMPLFPLDAVTLLPQQVLPLHIFEPRYRQMVGDVLDASGQIAMGVFRGNRWKQEYHGRPPVRPSVCVGQIVQHEKLADGRYNVLIQGVCRARIDHELAPRPEVEYREVSLSPVGVGETDEGLLAATRDRLEHMLSDGPLTRLSAASAVAEYARDEELPTSALLELVSFTMVGDTELRYRLLAEGDATERARLVERELGHLEGLIRRADAQRPDLWPKGVSWN